MGILKFLADLIYPPKCVFCGKLLDKGENGACERCRVSLPETDGEKIRKKGEFFDICVSPLYYKDSVRDSLLRYKFEKRPSYAESYASFLAETIREELEGGFDVITYVPVSRKRKAVRGFDQSKLLAEKTAEKLGFEAKTLLKKVRETPPQSSLKTVEKRRANVMDVYEAVSCEDISGSRILLIDDIITTGATLSECSRTLLMAGAESVLCAALARSD